MTTRDRYLPTMSVDGYLRVIAETYPWLHRMLDIERMRSPRVLAALGAATNEFDSDETGRGDSYRRAQRDALVRWTGVRQLLAALVPDGLKGTVTVLDVLGGDGTIARAAAAGGGEPMTKVDIVTGDISGPMVQRALGHGLPAVRQAAELLLLRDGSVDASLLAYGTHHIAPADRPVAIAEAMRVVRAGGRVVVHDFDGSSPMAAFFGQVVHRHSAAGHEYEHFSRADLAELFRPHATRLRVIDMYDPFVVEADTPDAARRALCDYLADMYGVPAVLGPQVPIEDAWGLVERCFEQSAYLSALAAPPAVPERPRVREADGRYVAEVPRMAVVAVAEKGQP